ncbi:MAG: guanylate kinase [Lachnospiraceae bacterium]|jgi:guanylate kinase
MSKIFYIMGKSASGKDKIYKMITGKDKHRKKAPLSHLLKPLVLYTTRPIRENEKDGEQYHFVTSDFLELKQKEGKIIERRDYHTVCGIWSYCTLDDGTVGDDGNSQNYIGIGTLESFVRLREYYKDGTIVPIYIEVSDEKRLKRAMKREAGQQCPNYKEMCRRFIADSEDFSDEKIAAAGITRVFSNDGKVEDCLKEVEHFICGEI